MARSTETQITPEPLSDSFLATTSGRALWRASNGEAPPAKLLQAEWSRTFCSVTVWCCIPGFLLNRLAVLQKAAARCFLTYFLSLANGLPRRRELKRVRVRGSTLRQPVFPQSPALPNLLGDRRALCGGIFHDEGHNCDCLGVAAVVSTTTRQVADRSDPSRAEERLHPRISAERCWRCHEEAPCADLNSIIYWRKMTAASVERRGAAMPNGLDDFIQCGAELCFHRTDECQ